jgi:hypothetical protein
MPLDTEKEEALLSLLACELFRREPRINASAVDWASVLDEGNRHAVAALLYPGMKRLEGVPQGALAKARGAAIFAAESSESMLNNQQAVLALLREREDLDAVHGVLEENHYMLAETGEMHICFQKLGLWVEVHRMASVFPNNEKGEFTKKHMLGALCHVQTAQVFGVPFPALTGMYQLIALLTHMERHLTSFGIGLRQMCDWAVTVHAQREEIGKAELALLDRCGLLHFAKIATRLCEKRLGLPPFGWSADVPDALTDALLRDILDGGNFQSQDQIRPLGNILTDAYNIQDSAKSSVLRSYIQNIRNRVRHEHPWAKSNLWIAFFSVFYLLRWTVRMLQGKRKKVNLSQAIRSAQSRESFLRELRLYR